MRSRSVVFQSASRCARTGLQETTDVALAGTRVAWLNKAGVNSLGTLIKTATLTRRTPIELAGGGALDGVADTFVRPPVGDGTLLVFTQNCTVTRTTRTTSVLPVAKPTTSSRRPSGGWPGGARALKVGLEDV
jgi:hypothetical protein